MMAALSGSYLSPYQLRKKVITTGGTPQPDKTFWVHAWLATIFGLTFYWANPGSKLFAKVQVLLLLYCITIEGRHHWDFCISESFDLLHCYTQDGRHHWMGDIGATGKFKITKLVLSPFLT